MKRNPMRAREFNEQELKIQWTNPVMPEEIYQFAEAYAAYAARSQSEGAALDELIAKITPENLHAAQSAPPAQTREDDLRTFRRIETTGLRAHVPADHITVSKSAASEPTLKAVAVKV